MDKYHDDARIVADAIWDYADMIPSPAIEAIVVKRIARALRESAIFAYNDAVNLCLEDDAFPQDKMRAKVVALREEKP